MRIVGNLLCQEWGSKEKERALGGIGSYDLPYTSPKFYPWAMETLLASDYAMQLIDRCVLDIYALVFMKLCDTVEVL